MITYSCGHSRSGGCVHGYSHTGHVVSGSNKIFSYLQQATNPLYGESFGDLFIIC